MNASCRQTLNSHKKMQNFVTHNSDTQKTGLYNKSLSMDNNSLGLA